MLALLAGIYRYVVVLMGVTSMVYTWVSQASRELTSGRNNDQVPLTSVSSNEVLRRVILHFYIDVVVELVDDTVPWMQRGVLSLIEATTGTPPPIPDTVHNNLFDYRDILYSRLDTMGFPGILQRWFRVPGGGMSATIDVEISRRPDPDPLIIWWNWGLPGGGAATSPNGFWRMWSRCLLES
jgi:hypothetical protein